MESRSSTLNSSFEQMDLHTTIKKNLRSRIFLGKYVERVLVSNYVGYRDVVYISPAEEELCEELMKFRNQLKLMDPNKWIGITDSKQLRLGEDSVCLWVEGMSGRHQLGPYWFQIKNVSFSDMEVIVQLRCIRYISEKFLERDTILSKPKLNLSNKESNIKETINEAKETIKETAKELLTFQNIKDGCTFVIALFIAIIIGANKLLFSLGDFVILFLRESSVFIKNTTPFLLGCIDFFSKIVGGFYLLIAMFLRPSPNTINMQQRALEYSTNRYNSRTDRNYDNNFD